jgi:hypothetical protein
MKRLLLSIVIFLALASFAEAKSLICDPQPGVDYYVITGASWFPQPIPAQPDGSLKVSVDETPIGVTPIQIQACTNKFGGVCGDPTGYDLDRPTIPLRPANMRLIK